MTIDKLLKTDELPLSRKLTINLLYTAQWANDLLTAALKDHEISLQQFNVMRILRGQKGKLANLSTINERMVARTSNTTRLVDKLLKKNLVSRTTCPTNRRKVEITITAEGLSLLTILDEAVTQAELHITQQLNTNEKEQLNTLLNTIRE